MDNNNNNNKCWMVKFYNESGTDGSMGWYSLGPEQMTIGLFRSEQLCDQRALEWMDKSSDRNRKRTDKSEIQWEEDKDEKRHQRNEQYANLKRKLDQFVDGLEDQHEKQIAKKLILLQDDNINSDSDSE